MLCFFVPACYVFACGSTVKQKLFCNWCVFGFWCCACVAVFRVLVLILSLAVRVCDCGLCLTLVVLRVVR